MTRRGLPLLCVAVLLSACGSSGDSGKTTPIVHSPDLQRLPEAPERSGGPPSSRDTARSAFLRAIFDDAQAKWSREFQGAGIRYRPARLTIFSQ